MHTNSNWFPAKNLLTKNCLTNMLSKFLNLGSDLNWAIWQNSLVLLIPNEKHHWNCVTVLRDHLLRCGRTECPIWKRSNVISPPSTLNTHCDPSLKMNTMITPWWTPSDPKPFRSYEKNISLWNIRLSLARDPLPSSKILHSMVTHHFNVWTLIRLVRWPQA